MISYFLCCRVHFTFKLLQYFMLYITLADAACFKKPLQIYRFMSEFLGLSKLETGKKNAAWPFLLLVLAEGFSKADSLLGDGVA